ncbi:MAG: hypothetical protein KIPDCIKN_00854 [Haliscomenobacter sp.]|jgi:RecB family exonuclease|nr:hypothetical protein [Haliscomenobacter sp.]
MKEVAAILEQGGLTKVTPSTWLSLRQCAWRVLLARHYQNKPLLPTHPNAILGTILHIALEKITKGELKSKGEFDLWWDTAIAKAEHELVNKGWGQFVPLKENTRHFGLKKIQARNRLQIDHHNHYTRTSTLSKATEQKLTSADGLLTGQLDCIIWQNGQAEIRDYKTGKITTVEEGEETAKVKEEYELQMRLYACLFHEHYGYFPSSLVLEDLNGVEHQVNLNLSECLQLMDEIRSTLSEINRKIENGEWEKLADTGEHCRYCQNRPACKKYLILLETVPFSPEVGSFDLIGKLTGYEQSPSGYILKIERCGVTYTINCADLNSLSEISAMTNQNVAIFNLRTAGAQKFACSKFSQVYAI